MTAQALQETPLPCEEGHKPDFEMICEIPDVLQGVFGMAPTQKRLVCVECWNTKEYFQKYHVTGTKRELTILEGKQYV